MSIGRKGGTATASLFGRTRSALLSLIYGHVDESFYVLQLVRSIGAGHGAVQRELRHLTELGLLERKMQGNQVLFKANRQSPIFPEIKSLITKTIGMHDMIRSSLAPLASQIQIALIYGSVARQAEKADSDVDVMIIGSTSFGDVVSALAPAQKAIGREINPTIFPLSEFRSKLEAGNHFLRSIMKEKKLFLIGSDHELAKLAAK